MNKQNLELLTREDFSCLASDCPRTCCIGFSRIEIDEGTLTKWKDTKDPKDREFLVGSYELDSGGVPVMKHTEDIACVALDDQNLCGIHKKFGHHYISDTCRDFPFIEAHNHYRSYYSASFSCPDIVERTLFRADKSPLFLESDNGHQNKQADRESTVKERLLYQMDNFVSDIFQADFPIGSTLYFMAQVCVDILDTPEPDTSTEASLAQVMENMDMHLEEITAAVKCGKFRPHPVTAGSYWKTVYDIIESRNEVNHKYLGKESSRLVRAFSLCDGSDGSFNDVYEAIKHYKKKANKQIKRQYSKLFRNYVRTMFINKGFPLSPQCNTPRFALVDCLIDLSVLQLFIWIEANKKGRLTDQFLKECIVEVDRTFLQNPNVIKNLSKNPRMAKIENYSESFVDMF